ncbi:MAG: hypothetical protein WA138_01560 [Parvibaculum sp.]
MKKSARTEEVAEPDWTAIRVKYEIPEIPMRDVAAGTGMQWQKISAYAARHGWKLRKPRTRAQKDDARRDMGLQPTRLATRLKRLIAREISSIENEDMSKRPAADRERDARRLSSLVRSLEKLNDIKAAKNKREREEETGEPDDEAIHAELQRRFDRLAAAGGEGKPSAKPEPSGETLAG